MIALFAKNTPLWTKSTESSIGLKKRLKNKWEIFFCGKI